MTLQDDAVKTLATSEVVNLVCPCPFTEPLAAHWVAYAGTQRLGIAKVDRETPAVQEVHHGARATCLAWSLKSLELAGPLLATGASDNHVRVVNASQETTVEVHEGHTGYVNACAFLGGAFLASTGDDHTLRVWDITKGECLKIFNLRSAGRHLHYTPDEPYKLVCMEQRGVFTEFDLREYQPSASTSVPVTDEPVMDADVCPFEPSRSIVAIGHRQLLVHRDGNVQRGGMRAAQTLGVRWSRTQRDVFASRSVNNTIHLHHCTQGSYGDVKHADGSVVTGSSMGWMSTSDTLVVSSGKRLHFVHTKA